MITSGEHPNVIFDLVQGEQIGTRFLFQADRLEGRKLWLLGAPLPLVQQQKLLLPARTHSVSGQFSRGEVVKIFNQQGKTLALGMTRYGREALERIKGRKSSDIEQILGYEFVSVALHRDEMVVY